MGNRFETTRWSLVLAVQGAGTEQSLEALTALCEAYWQPLYAHVRRRCRSREEAEDLTQAFFSRLLEKRYLDQVRPEAGRLRSFLLASLDHFLMNERDHEQALKRGGAYRLVSLDSLAADARSEREHSSCLSPEEEFERQWALTVLERARARLRDEWSSAGKEEQHAVLQAYLTGEEPARPYRDVAEGLATSEGAVKVAVHRLRRRLGELLREEVAQTVVHLEDVDAEIRHLLEALGRRGSG